MYPPVIPGRCDSIESEIHFTTGACGPMDFRACVLRTYPGMTAEFAASDGARRHHYPLSQANAGLCFATNWAEN
jgi:hypothetical protein